MQQRSKPNHRLRKVQNAKNLVQPKIHAVVELQKPNLEMHLEPPPTSGAPDVCTGNPLCYCVGVETGGKTCSCDQVCSCDAVCAKDPACSCVGHTCTCEGHCSCQSYCGSHCSCDPVCTAYCTCNWNGICSCDWVCTWYPM